MDNFLVSARKYRPLRWIDVAGQDHITNTLKSALQQGQVAHAFLLQVQEVLERQHVLEYWPVY